MRIEGWLVVDGSGKLRVYNKREPHLKWNEVGFKLRIKVASSWGQTAGIIDLEIPEGIVAIEPQEMIIPKEEKGEDNG